MVYEATVQEDRSAVRMALYSIGLLATGMVFGALLMQVQGAPHEVSLKDALQVAPIAGEVWHGNVRSSAQ